MDAVPTRLKRISKTDDSIVTPPNHKWTEVGVLPKDWSVQSLRSCLLSAPSYGINEAAVPFDSDLPTYLRITDISEDGQFRPLPRVSVKHPNGQAFFLNEGDLILARTGASVGKSYLYNPKDGPLVFAGFLIRINPNPEKLHSTFLAYCLQSKYYWNWVATMSIRSGQPGINGKEYGELQLPLPSLPEQRAIAEALSDVDGLLNALDALIAKKQAIKQATMQQLLTGKTRLPGFSGVWEKTKMGNIGSIYGGLSGKSKVDFGGGNARYVTFLGVLENVILHERHIERVHVGPKELQNRVMKGDLLFNASSETPGDLAMGAVMSEQLDNLYLNSFCFGVRVHNESKHVPLFLAYFFRGTVGRAIMNSLAQGATRYNMSKSQFLSLELSIPSCNEQYAIASVLLDMDAEITALKKRRDKTCAIKQGMMQQLLTGRVRLSESRICTDDTD